jgi:hypothetical protein
MGNKDKQFDQQILIENFQSTMSKYLSKFKESGINVAGVISFETKTFTAGTTFSGGINPKQFVEKIAGELVEYINAINENDQSIDL